MAYESKFTSIKPIIEAAYRDSVAEDINMETALEDIGEVIGLIGVPYTYIDKCTNGDDGLSGSYDTLALLESAYPSGADGIYLVKDENNLYIWDSDLSEWSDNGEYIPSSPLLEVINYRAYLPSDVAYILSLRKIEIDGNNKVTTAVEMIEDPSMFFYDRLLTPPEPNWVWPVADHPLNTVDDSGDITSDSGVIVGQVQPPYRNSPYKYKINNNVIFTDFESGYIDMAYKAIPVDSDGFIMVPDDEKLRTAIKYHLIYKIDYRNWRVNPASPGLKALLNDSEQRRDFYVGAARNKSHIPTLDKMESIKNMWLRLIPKINEHRSGYTTMNIQEKRKY